MPDTFSHQHAFTQGAVTRVIAKHFLTFSEFEMCPEPKLNLIIGPNGTGKSSLVNAIVLGLAGKTSLLGRATNLTDYIQYGYDKAYIEIELHNEKGKNWKVGREIKKSGNSVWTINGQVTSQEVVKSLMNDLKIQVDNLCQFLPQDKVADFAKMGPMELLVNTQKAAGADGMYRDHQQLIEVRSKARELESHINSGEADLETEIGQNARIDDQLKRFEERERNLANIELLKQKRAWLEYDAARIKYEEKKKERDHAQKELEKLASEFAPQEKDLVVAKSKLQKAKTNLARLAESREETEKLRKVQTKFDEQNDKILEVKNDLQGKKQAEEQRLNKIESDQQKILLMENQLKECNKDIQGTQERLKSLGPELNNLSQEISFTENAHMNWTSDRNAKQQRLNDCEYQLRKLRDVGRQREELLMRRNHDAYRALLWMRENKSQFKSNVYEPIMLNINMLDTRYAKYVESHIPFKDMIAFLFEDIDDRELFMRKVRDELNLMVNAADVPKETMAQFNTPTRIEQIKKWGFQTYLRDVFQAPDGVMRYLCKMYRIHTVPIGNEVTDKLVERVIKETNFTRFYTLNTQFASKTSKYNRNIKSTLTTEVRPPNLLAASTDNAKIAELETLCKDLAEGIKNMNVEIAKFKQDESDKKKTLEKLRMEQKKLGDELNLPKMLQARIRHLTEIREKSMQRSYDIKEGEANARAKIKKLILSKAGLLQESTNTIKSLLVLRSKRVLAAMQQAIAEQDLNEAQNALDTAKQALADFQESLEKIKAELKTTKHEAQKLIKIAKEMSGLTGHDSLSDSLKASFSNLPHELDEIDARIFEEQARSELICTVDPSVVQEYHRRAETIIRLQKDLDTRKNRLADYQKIAEDVKRNWLTRLEELVERINQNFSRFFSKLKCAGEVLLDKTNNEEDFDKWGISIQVKFRDSEPLRALDGSHHSGGEQSVSTALYMLALQELTQVPFRCVDEINQGMDPKNERKVFDLITETACRKNNAQYFLLTPKLLPDLEYSENMKIFVINNGPFFNCGKDWSIPRFLNIAKNLPADDED